MCDDAGWRRVTTAAYPTGAMRECTHDPVLEGRISPDVLNWPPKDGPAEIEKGLAEGSPGP